MKKILLLIVLSLILSGCSKKAVYYGEVVDNETIKESQVPTDESSSETIPDEEKTTTKEPELESTTPLETETSEEITTESTEEIVTDPTVLEKIIDSNVNLSSNDTMNFINTLDSIKVDYKYSEYFEIDKAMAEYEKNTLNEVTYDLNIIDDKLEVETLYEIVKRNNEQYLDEHSAINKYTMPSDGELRTVCEWICDSINYEIDNHPVDIKAIEQRVSVLKIFSVNYYAYGYYSLEDELMAYNKKMIDTNGRSTLFEETICHETKHLVQIPSKQEVENTNIKDVAGVCYGYKDLIVNSLNPDWLSEGIAELQTLKQLNIEKSLNYQELINSIELLVLSTINKNEVGDFEKICMGTNLEELYKYFGAETPEERQEISTMLFALNIIKLDNTTSTTYEFYNYFKEINGESMDYTTRRYYQYNLSSSIAQTMSKIFYENLAIAMENKNIPLADVFSLITCFEIKLSEQCRYYDIIRAEELESFFVNYTVMQEEFYGVIAEKIGCTLEEVMESYQLFYDKYELSENISIISEKKQKYVKIIPEKYNYYKQGTVVQNYKR